MKALAKIWLIFITTFIGSIFFLSASASAWQWPKEFTISTTGLGTGTYALTVAWGAVLEENTGMKVRVLPSNNYSERARAHKQGRAIFNIDTITELNSQIEARDKHATRLGGAYDTNLAWVGMQIPFGFIVTKDSEIKTVYDLKKKKGLKASLFTRSGPSVAHIKGILAWAGVDEKDVIFVPTTSWGGNTKTVVEGRADITLTSPISTVTYEVEAHPKGIRWIDFPKDDKEGMKRYLSKMRGIFFAPNQKGVKSAKGINTVQNIMFYHAKADADPELVYNVAKWFGENYDLYKDKHKGIKDMTLEKMKKALVLASDMNFIPIHPGTIKYLKEKGMWSAEDTAWNDKNKKLIKQWVKAYDDAIATADQKKIKINPKNKEWINIWNLSKEKLDPFGTGH